MPTIRQKKLAEAVIDNMALDKPKNKQELVASVGYTIASADKKATEILSSKGVQQALEEYGFTIDNAKMVVSEIMLNPDVDPNARLKATDQVFKVKDGYAATKNVNVNLNVSSEAREKSREAISQFLNGEN